MQLVYKSMSMAGSVAAVPRGNTAKIMSHIIIAKLVHPQRAEGSKEKWKVKRDWKMFAFVHAVPY